MKQNEELITRVKLCVKWLNGEIQKERDHIQNHGAYIDNKDYFMQLRLRPLIATRKLIFELAAKTNIQDKEIFPDEIKAGEYEHKYINNNPKK